MEYENEEAEEPSPEACGGWTGVAPYAEPPDDKLDEEPSPEAQGGLSEVSIGAGPDTSTPLVDALAEVAKLNEITLGECAQYSRDSHGVWRNRDRGTAGYRMSRALDEIERLERCRKQAEGTIKALHEQIDEERKAKEQAEQKIEALQQTLDSIQSKILHGPDDLGDVTPRQWGLIRTWLLSEVVI